MKDFLARFTPSLMSPETLEGIFVQREKLAADLVENIRQSALTPSKHYMLLIGPRGMGKTHLVALVYHRIKAMEDLQDRLCIAWMREEEWGITTFRDVLLSILRALHEEYGDAELAEETEKLYELSPDDAEREAEALLKNYVGKRALLILIENLGDIFKDLRREGQQQLRAFLQNHGFATILATAQSLFSGVSLRTSPFYGFFNIHHLPELSLDDAVRLLTKVAEYEEDAELVAFLQTPKGRARVRAVHHLAGGNPRVYLIFSQFLTRESLDDLVEPFMQMLDDLTPYYQSRMVWLSPLQRKIIEFLIENQGAAPVKAIAQRVFKSHQTISSQLKALRDSGYVQSKTVGRESYYELREPLMRLAIEVKKNRGKPIRLLIDFLRLWYTRPELEERLKLLQSEAVLEREYVLHALEISGEEAENPLVAACSEDFLKYFDEGDFERSLKAAEELVEVRGYAIDWLVHGMTLARLKHFEEALKSFEKSIDLKEDFILSWEGRALVLGVLGRIEESIEVREQAIKLGSDYAPLSFGLVPLWLHLGRWDEGVIALEKALGRFVQQEDDRNQNSIDILKYLLVNSHEFSRKHFDELVAIYAKYDALDALVIGLMASIYVSIDPNVTDDMMLHWLDTWKEVLDGRDEFRLPLRLLDAGIRYQIVEDQRVLLELPVEERTFLEKVLELEVGEPTSA